MPRYLTKSRYKLAHECPTKLFYTNKKEYANKNIEDPFMAALAEGGHQVGALAKCYFPEGIDIEPLDYDEALEITNDHLKKEKVILFEPAVKFQNLFIRVDVLIKNGDKLELIEVKAKSYEKEGEKNPFLTNKGTIQSK